MAPFFAAVIFLCATPGPGVLSLAGVAAAFGSGKAYRYMFGLFLGNFLVALMVISGLAALILADPRIRIVLFALSLAYLASIAIRIAFARSKIAFIEKAEAPGIRDGVILQVINPKAYAVSTTIFSGFILFADNYSLEVIVKLLIFNGVWIPVHFMWLFLGIWLNQLNLPEHQQRRINYAMAGSMMMVVLLAAYSAFT